jgi:type IV secretory pathway ATPase VirB11/archaellum biosynthesis ATPase
MSGKAVSCYRSRGTGKEKRMPKIYREIAVTNMIGTVEDAMRRVLNNWAELPAEMQDAIDQFRIQLDAAIDSVYIVKRALDTQIHKSEEDR